MLSGVDLGTMAVGDGGEPNEPATATGGAEAGLGASDVGDSVDSIRGAGAPVVLSCAPFERFVSRRRRGTSMQGAASSILMDS